MLDRSSDTGLSTFFEEAREVLFEQIIEVGRGASSLLEGGRSSTCEFAWVLLNF